MTEASVTKKSKTPKLFPDELIDQLLAQIQGKDAESVLGESGLAGQLKKQLAERMLAAELSHHLQAEAEQGTPGNHRNGTSPKTVLTPNGELKLDIPRDRQATFEPQLVGKYPFFAYPPEVRRIVYTTDEIDKPPHVVSIKSVFAATPAAPRVPWDALASILRIAVDKRARPVRRQRVPARVRS